MKNKLGIFLGLLFLCFSLIYGAVYFSSPLILNLVGYEFSLTYARTINWITSLVTIFFVVGYLASGLIIILLNKILKSESKTIKVWIFVWPILWFVVYIILASIENLTREIGLLPMISVVGGWLGAWALIMNFDPRYSNSTDKTHD